MANKLNTPDDFKREFDKRTGEAEYQHVYKKDSDQAVQDMMRKEGKTLSAARKIVQKEVRRLADAENAAQQQRLSPMGQAIINMQRAKDSGGAS